MPSIYYRWAFLQMGVERIMKNLRDGVDMVTVGDLTGII